MKARKSVAYIAILALVCLCFAGCSADAQKNSSGDGNSVEGAWEAAVVIDDNGQELTGGELEQDEADITFNFRDDGTCTMVQGTDSADGTWTQSGDKVEYDIGDGKKTATLDGDKLTLADGTILQRA